MWSNKSMLKLKVWELIYNELKNSGYKVGDSTREGTLKTFQKWRNLERAYWKCRKDELEGGDDVMKRKPFFYNDMHNVLSKRDDYESKLNLLLSKKYREISMLCANKEMEDMLTDSQDDSLSMDSLASAKDSRLRRKWSVSNKVKQKLNKQKMQKTHYTERLSKQILMEYSKMEAELPTLDKIRGSHTELIKAEVLPSDATAYLLSLIASDKYYKLLDGNKQMMWVWNNIFCEMEVKGFNIKGSTVTAKSKRLLRKWRSLKQLFFTYQMNKIKGLDVEKPPYYNLILKIVHREIIESKSSVIKKVIPSLSKIVDPQLDHDYERCVLDPDLVLQCQDDSPLNVGLPNTDCTPSRRLQDRLRLPKPSPMTHSQSELCSTLMEIKSLHEKSLADQQVNFLKIASLLEEQVNQQKILNNLFTEYVVNQSKKRNSKDKNH